MPWKDELIMFDKWFVNPVILKLNTSIFNENVFRYSESELNKQKKKQRRLYQLEIK